MRIFFAIFLTTTFSGCSLFPASLDHNGCEQVMLLWTLGPEPGEAFIDACYTDLDAELLAKAYQMVPITGTNRDTKQPMDSNRDGVSGNGAWRQSTLHWGGQGCQQYARRITQKKCDQIGMQNRTLGCDWVAVQIIPKPGIQSARGELQPIWHVRLPDGTETKRAGRAFNIGFSGCAGR